MTRTTRYLLVVLTVLVTITCSALDTATGGISVWAFILLVVTAVAMVLRRPVPPAVNPAVASSSPAHAPVLPYVEPPAPSTRDLLREGLVLGLTGFGGGLAVLSQIEHRLVERNRWINDETFLESAALAQSLPGAVAFNALGFIGRRLAGVRGALALDIGFVLPSFLLLLAFALLYAQLRGLAVVDGLFHALNPAAAGLVAATALRLGGRVVLTPTGEPGGWRGLFAERWMMVVFVASAVAVGFMGFGVIEVLLTAGALGVVRHLTPGGRVFLDTVEVRWRWLRWRVWIATQSELLGPRRPWWRRRVDEDEMLAIAPGIVGLMPTVALLMGRLQLFGSLCSIFLRAGALTFGGGFVMIPLLEAELVQARGWLSPQAFADAMALGQVTPGPVVITATFVGYRIAGLGGAVLSTVAVFLPAFALVLLVSSSIERFRETLGVQAFLQGIQPAIVGLMLAAAVSLARNGIHDWVGAAIALLSFLLLWRWRVNPMWVVLGACALGVIEGQVRQVLG
jgi:chromate transporter